MRRPRVAFFPDSFHEVNGVGHTARNFVGYAQRHGYPFLCVRAGDRAMRVMDEGSVTTLELPRSWASFALEKDLAFDPLFARHTESIADALHRFRPDILHMTGPSELGIAAAYFAHTLGVPLVASWHTNVHEYAARRLPGALRGVAGQVERSALAITSWFYRQAQVLYAPNEELCALLRRTTGRPCHLMERGVDTKLFTPARRTRVAAASEPFVLGFVGRLSVEKNVALLPVIQRALDAAGLRAKFVIVGQGSEEAALRRELPGAVFAGVLRGEALAAAYADMDLLVFPSHTDTFGNVVLEALASGVPAVVTPDGGPRFIVRTADSGEPETGVVAAAAAFAGAIAAVLGDAERLRAMRANARRYAERCTWDAVFDRVYAAYPASG